MLQRSKGALISKSNKKIATAYILVFVIQTPMTFHQMLRKYIIFTKDTGIQKIEIYFCIETNIAVQYLRKIRMHSDGSATSI